MISWNLARFQNHQHPGSQAKTIKAKQSHWNCWWNKSLTKTMPFSRFPKQTFKKTQSTLTTSREPFVFFVDLLHHRTWPSLWWCWYLPVRVPESSPPTQNGRLGSQNKYVGNKVTIFLKFRLFVFEEKTWKFNLADLWYSPLIYAETL